MMPALPGAHLVLVHAHLTLATFETRFQTLLGTRAIRHVLGHVACLPSLLVPCPLLGQVQAEIEQGMIVARHVPHEDAHLAIVDLSPVATPLALDSDRVRAAFGEAAWIESDDASGFTQPSGHLAD